MTTISQQPVLETASSASGIEPHVQPFLRDKFLLKQKRLSLTETYSICDEQGRQILFVQREAHHLKSIGALLAGIVTGLIVASLAIMPVVMLAKDSTPEWLIATGLIIALAIAAAAAVAVGLWLRPKRHLRFCTDQGMQQQVMTILQDKKFAFINATYTAADPDLELLGWYRKNYLYDIFRKRWHIHGPTGELVCVALEDSILRSILRRVARDVLPLMRTNFILMSPDFATKYGEFNRRFTLFDQYVLDLTPDAQRRFDRRLAAGLGVLLDTAERR